MKTTAKILSLIAATVFAFSSVVRAQPQTFTTEPNYSNSVFTFSGGASLGQTFSSVYSVASITYDFFQGTGGSTPATTLSAVFGQWTGSGFLAGTTVTFNNIVIPSSSSWTSTLGSASTYRLTFDLTDTGTNPSAGSTLATIDSSNVLLDNVFGYFTNPSSSYALLLTNTGSDSNLGLGLTNTNAFAFGSTNIGFNDWTFAQVAVATTNPVPESATVAALLGGLLVAGLVTFRLRQQRQLAAIPVATTAA